VDKIAIQQARTLPEMFSARLALTPDRPAYRQHDGLGRCWIDWTWRGVGNEFQRWQAALADEGLVVGSRVATLMRNSVGYVLVDQAALSLGLVIVPLHLTDNPGNVAYILADSEACVLVIDDPAYWDRLAPEIANLSSIKRIILASDERLDEARHSDSRVIRSSLWLSKGRESPVTLPDVRSEMMAALVYTSGTTGRPKGVMLSHLNVVSNVIAAQECILAKEADVFLSFLPLSHTLERTIGYYLPIAAGSTVAFARSSALLNEDMRTVSPTILISVPRIYERMHVRIREESDGSGALSRILLGLTEDLGWRRFLAEQGRGRRLPALASLAWQFLDKVVARRVRAAFGGRLRLAVAGGAPMPATVSRFFLAMGINIIQGYGMTETSPVVCVNRPGNNDPETVGEPIPGVEIRIGEHEELLVRGPNIMLGYWKRPEETRRILGEDGWLHSGDRALEREGQVVIKGRIKDIIVTSTGEKVSPGDLENAILQDPLFEQVLVIGEQRPFIAALAVIDRVMLAETLKSLRIDAPLERAPTFEVVRAHALKKIEAAVSDFPKYATPRKVWLTLDPWTVADGLMTPTLKPKRAAILERFRDAVDGLYAK